MEKISIRSNLSILDLLRKYKLHNKKVAIEHNGKIITKSNYKKNLKK